MIKDHRSKIKDQLLVSGQWSVVSRQGVKTSLQSAPKALKFLLLADRIPIRESLA
jgi:hypothetical protein